MPRDLESRIHFEIESTTMEPNKTWIHTLRLDEFFIGVQAAKAD